MQKNVSKRKKDEKTCKLRNVEELRNIVKATKIKIYTQVKESGFQDLYLSKIVKYWQG